MTKKKFNQPPTYFVIAWRGRKWEKLTDQPVLRPTAVRLIQEAWKAGNMARMRSVQRAEAAA